MTGAAFTCARLSDYLYIGGAHASPPEHVRHVLGVGESYDGPRNDWLARRVIEQVEDSSSQQDLIERVIPAAVDFIQRARDAKQVVYLHCRFGQSRSPAIAVACFMKLEGMGVEAALSRVSESRPEAWIHREFLQQLYQYEKLLVREAKQASELRD